MTLEKIKSGKYKYMYMIDKNKNVFKLTRATIMKKDCDIFIRHIKTLRCKIHNVS